MPLRLTLKKARKLLAETLKNMGSGLIVGGFARGWFLPKWGKVFEEPPISNLQPSLGG